MKKLLQGIAEFRRTKRAEYAPAFEHLALGQEPDALLIACSDSRVVPNVFASAEPGDLFVVRNVGNLVPPLAEPQGHGTGDSVAAAIEFALRALSVKDVVVCGHSECGAVGAIHSGTLPPDAPHLEAWLRHGRDMASVDLPDRGDLSTLHHRSQQNVLLQIEHLRTYPAVREAEAAGRLALHAWWFAIAQAEVLDYDEGERRFVPLDEERVERLLRGR